MRRIHTLTICLALVGLGTLLAGPVNAQTPRPNLFPNKHLETVGQTQANRDIAECSASANIFLEDQGRTGGQTRNLARGAARGAAAGALAGTITGNNAGRGAGAGAAIGGLNSASQNRNERRSGSPEFQRYVEICLEERGYKVLSWR